MITPIKKYLKSTPSDTKVQDLLTKCEGILESKAKKIHILESIECEFYVFKHGKIKIANQALDTEDWDKKKDNKKRELYAELACIYKQLKASNTKDLILGLHLFVLILLLFIGSLGGYLYQHEKMSPPKNSSNEEIIGTEDLINIQKEVNILFTSVKQSNIQNMEKIKGSLSEIESYLSKEPLNSKSSYDLKKNFGILIAGVETDGIAIEALIDFSELLDAEIETINSTFFWRTTPKKWCEICFWAYCGVLVGILFYMASLLETGIFPKEIIPMILTEIIITPPVVLMIFFLFPITGLTNIIPSESSIHMSIGIAFVLGFAIRRTVGLLDTIKRRILPDPLHPSEKK